MKSFTWVKLTDLIFSEYWIRRLYERFISFSFCQDRRVLAYLSVLYNFSKLVSSIIWSMLNKNSKLTQLLRTHHWDALAAKSRNALILHVIMTVGEWKAKTKVEQLYKEPKVKNCPVWGCKRIKNKDLYWGICPRNPTRVWVPTKWGCDHKRRTFEDNWKHSKGTKVFNTRLGYRVLCGCRIYFFYPFLKVMIIFALIRTIHLSLTGSLSSL